MKKTIATLLAIVLILSCCTSCGKETASGTAPSSSEAKPLPKAVAETSTGLSEECQHTFAAADKSDGGCYYTETAQCTSCGGVKIEFFETTGHKVEIDAGVPVTCRSNGFTDKVYCKTCDKTLSEKEIIPLDITAHLIFKTTVPATLMSGSRDVERCIFCKTETVVSTSDKIASPDKAGVPVIRLEGNLEKATKEHKEGMKFSYKDGDTEFTCFATVKVQGNTSSEYEKKNYSVKLYNDEAHTDKNKVDLGWGKEFKYVLKANYIDASQARNIVNARLYARICRENPDHNPILDTLPNMGVTDGYPVAIYLGNEFYGMYTLNIPKENWMFDMKTDEGVKQAMLMLDDWQPSVYFKEHIAPDFSNGWDVEHCSTQNTAWIRTSFNKYIDFVKANDGEALKKGLPDYVDVESVIDTMLFHIMINAYDNYVKNMIYVTYDGGDTWICNPYDLDSTWGLYWDGSRYVDVGTGTIAPDGKGGIWFRSGVNILWPKLFVAYKSEIKARYAELRSGVMSEESIMAEFDKYFDSVPEILRKSEAERWPDIPQLGVDQREQIEEFMTEHLSELDSVIYNY